MTIRIGEHDPVVTIKVRDINFIFRAVDTAHSELEAAVADGDVKEEVTEDLLEAMAMIRRALKGDV